MAGPRVILSRLVFKPATPSRWTDVETLFGERGACGGCWCMFLRLPAKVWERGKGSRNKRAFRKLIDSGARPGIIAYYNRESIGWCAIAPWSDYPRLARSRVLRPIDGKPVWSVTCLFIAKPFRRSGVSARLLHAASEFAASRGARIVEGYPSAATMHKTPDAFLWRGVPSSFERAGFREVARPSKSRRIMRRYLRRRT
jgi:GNAT superfamily N-acetyltransferase